MREKLLHALAIAIPGPALALMLTPAAPAAVTAGRAIAAACLTLLCYVLVGYMAKKGLGKPVKAWLRLAISYALSVIALAAAF